MLSQQDQQFMNQALELALQATFLCDPNPRVGCVLVQNGQVIGKGFTQRPGKNHAEIQALQDAQKNGASSIGATAYVTLEPCCHYGKTPPCTQALLDAQVSRVVIAATDPNPLVSGKGIAHLRAHGIQVDTGLCEFEAMMQNQGFMKRMKDHLPWVRLKIAASLDGITALPNQQSQWITSEAARLDGRQWRAQASVLLTGIGTVRTDNPQLNVRDTPLQQSILRAVIDSQLEIPLEARILHNGPCIIFSSAVNSPAVIEKRSALDAIGVKVIELPNRFGKVDLPKVFSYLAMEHQANEVHVEAGFKLNGSLIREQCVDELLIYMAPILLGNGAGLAQIGPLETLDQKSRWNFLDIQRLDTDIRLRLIREIKNA
jgi:diaminohydroxyphosphoribosylaminopyrimidine deaminase/5-amino-6-(5-phosphoribosylamino)uracil reductase